VAGGISRKNVFQLILGCQITTPLDTSHHRFFSFLFFVRCGRQQNVCSHSGKLRQLHPPLAAVSCSCAKPPPPTAAAAAAAAAAAPLLPLLPPPQPQPLLPPPLLMLKLPAASFSAPPHHIAIPKPSPLHSARSTRTNRRNDVSGAGNLRCIIRCPRPFSQPNDTLSHSGRRRPPQVPRAAPQRPLRLPRRHSPGG
jgi:hypothetical protein